MAGFSRSRLELSLASTSSRQPGKNDQRSRRIIDWRADVDVTSHPHTDLGQGHDSLYTTEVALPVESAPFFIPWTLILFTVLLVHLLRISPHHSHYLRSHHLSLPLPFTPDLKRISFTNPFLHSHSYSFPTAFMHLNLYWFNGALALFVLVSATCARLAVYSAFESTLNSSIVSYRTENEEQKA